MIVGIPYKSNQLGLSALLCMLQPQLKSTDAIYVIDNSEDRSGLKIAQMYGSSRMPIVVETGNYSIYQSWNIAIDFMLDNNDDSVLLLNDDVVISQTLVTNLKRALITPYLAIVPSTPDRRYASRRLDPNFTWYNKMDGEVVPTDWLCGFAFCLKKEAIKQVGKFNEEFKVWFGDDEYNDRLMDKIGRISDEYVYHFGSSSFTYTKPEVLQVIKKDREKYVQLSGQTTPSNRGIFEDNPRSR